MSRTLKDFAILAAVTVVSTLLIWAPFILKLKSFWGLEYPTGGMEIIWRNFDGLNYIAVAKSFYQPQILKEQFSSLGLPPIYFASHFPVYPALIWLFSYFFGFLNSMLFVTLLFTILSAFIFYLLVRDFNLTSQPLWLTIVFLLLPARWVVVRSVGAPEPVFIFLILLSFYLLRKQLTFLASLVIAAAVWVRSPAAILWAAANLAANWPANLQSIKKTSHWLLVLLPPLAAVSLFGLYWLKYADFLAYFHSGDNIHLTWPIWSVFNAKQFWVGTFWLENIIYVYLLIVAATLILWRKRLYDFAFFCGLYFIASSFVVHLDIGRYTLPTFPFVIIALEKWLTTKEFKIAMVILLIPIYLFTQNFLIGNISPIVDFGPFR